MKILMVCLGNICRSPLAHGILQHLVNMQKLNWSIESAGTASWHKGSPPDKRSVKVAKKLGYDISTQKAKHFNSDCFNQFDYIFVMDNHNLKDVLALANTEAQRKKVSLFLVNDNVTDPYYDDSLFEPVAKQIEQRCKELIIELQNRI